MDASEPAGSRPFAYLLPVLSGILVGTSYIPFPPWAHFFCLVPLWLFWLGEISRKRILFGGWVEQFVFTLIGFHWVAHTAHEFGHLSWPTAALTLLLYCSVGHLFLPLSGLIWSLLRRRGNLPRWAQLGLLPAITAPCWHFSPMLFPWHLGYPWLWGQFPVYQLAEYVGFSELSALTVFINLAFLVAWECRKTPTGARVLGAALAFLVAINALEWLAGRNLPLPDATARVLVVQANIGNLAKVWAERGREYREEILGKYFTLTDKGWTMTDGRPPDFALWPESAYPGTFVPRGMDSGNALARVMVSPHGRFRPGKRAAGKIDPRIDPGPADLIRGALSPFLPLLGGQGAQPFVNVTNDSWFGTWTEPYQHLYMTRARGIEFRRPVVRATNTGISTMMLPDGTILNRSPLHRELFHSYDVPYRKAPISTFYQTYGYVLVPVILLLAPAGILLATGRRGWPVVF